jgi:hypothetical protein
MFWPNLIQEDIRRRQNSANACYHSVQNLLSSHLLSKNLELTKRVLDIVKMGLGDIKRAWYGLD